LYHYGDLDALVFECYWLISNVKKSKNRMPVSTRQPVNLQEIFNLIDKKGKGSVEASKIGDLLRYAGLNPTEKTCNQIIGNSKGGYYYRCLYILEKLGKNQITLNEFIAIHEENQDASLEFNSISEGGSSVKNSLNSMINAVRTFDHQGTGFISINELKFSDLCEFPVFIFKFLVLTGLGDKLKDEEFEDLRQFMEISPNGQISYERRKRRLIYLILFLEFITNVNES
jgi:Ca2+-binding EF-hand superfamily protein